MTSIMIDTLAFVSSSSAAIHVPRASHANPYNLLGYTPIVALTVIAAVLYALIAVAMICLLRVGRWRVRYMLTTIIATLC